MVKKKKDSYKIMEIILAIIGIILISTQVIILSKQSGIMGIQTQISNDQAEILRRTTQSNKADIEVFASQGYKKYSIGEMNDESNKQIGIGAVNLGKSIAPYATISLNFPGELFGYAVSATGEEDRVSEHRIFTLKEFESMEYGNAWQFFTKRYSSTEFSAGLYNLTFRIDCAFCVNPISIQEVPICIYTNESTVVKECGEEWRY